LDCWMTNSAGSLKTMTWVDLSCLSIGKNWRMSNGMDLRRAGSEFVYRYSGLVSVIGIWTIGNLVDPLKSLLK
jgi:hypothetical protein